MVSETSASLCWILLSVCFSVSCEGLLITAEPGRTVTLPCQAPSDTTVQVVEWIRRDLDNPTVCVYRGIRCENSHPSFKDRVQLNHDLVKNGDVSLILKNVMISDTGAYECRVRQRESKRRKRDVHLDHVDLIKPIVYLTVSNSGMLHITAEPGDTVTLPCQAPRNTTVQIVEWIRRDLDNPTVCVYRDGKWENSDPSFKDRVQLNNHWEKNGNVSLTLKNVTISDTGAYECHVRQRESKRRKRDVHLDDGDLIKPIVYLTVSNSGMLHITAEPGDTVTLPCQAPRNTTVQVVEWIRRDLDNPTVCFYRDGKWEINDPSFKDRVQLNNHWEKNGNVSLILKNVTISDTGAYECRVIQRESKRRKRDVHLDDGDLIKPIIYLTVGNSGLLITAEPGDTVTLPCQAPRNTNVQVVQWIRRDLNNPTVCFYRDGKCENSHPSFKGRVQLNRDRVKNGDVSLILKNVMISDSGAYECRVIQGESKRRKRDVHLDDGDLIKPIVYLTVGNSGLLITAEPGDTVTLPCQAPRNTTVQVVEWIRRDLNNPTVCFYRDGKCENSHPSFKGRVQLNRDRVKNGDVSLTLKNVMISDSGAYECHVIQRESKRRKRDVYLDDGDLIKPIVYLTVGNSANPGSSMLRIILHLVVFCPYFISTLLMVSLCPCRATERNPSAFMMTSPTREDDEGPDTQYDYVTADVTTEHHF
ncbi:immunoglobulin superfamily member 3-like isoform X2 [Channa argus]|uniref:immunoglobulin superfamily member 3-like isoform X2 n=1 Tax=Channa argus TaxID=215402 RepID=UPI003521028D